VLVFEARVHRRHLPAEFVLLFASGAEVAQDGKLVGALLIRQRYRGHLLLGSRHRLGSVADLGIAARRRGHQQRRQSNRGNRVT
jgi:hypothetical protein